MSAFTKVVMSTCIVITYHFIPLFRYNNKIRHVKTCRILVGEDGFEPSKHYATDLQSAPFGHSGTPPYSLGAGGRIRTPDLLITNQLLYRLSYTSESVRLSSNSNGYYNQTRGKCQVKNEKNFSGPKLFFIGRNTKEDERAE